MSRIGTLEEQLNHIKTLIRNMCDVIESGLSTLMMHFETPCPDKLLKIIVLDSEIDRIEVHIDEQILKILATKHPLGFELRLAYSYSQIVHIVERMGDSVESVARQLLNENEVLQKELLLEMIVDVKELFKRAYKAMFEEDFALIADIHTLDDKIDQNQRKLHLIAKSYLKEKKELRLESCLQMISMSSKLEKMADLCCRWGEVLDFAFHGYERKKLQKPKSKIIFLDNCGGIYASMAASFLYSQISDTANIVVGSQKTSQNSTSQILNYFDFLKSFGVSPQMFPVASLYELNWSHAVLLLILGDIQLSQEEMDAIPYKPAKLQWDEIPFDSERILKDPDFAKKFGHFLKEKSFHLAQIIKRI